MAKQLHFEITKLFFQKKYWLILISIIAASLINTHFQLRGNILAAEIMFSALSTFRPICWILCCYIVCDVISSDYHYNVLKNILPYTKNRHCYISSKFLVASGFCLLTFLTYTLGSFCAIFAFSSEHLWTAEPAFFASLALGALAGIFFLESVIILCMVITESEAITIGFSIGVIFLMLILESLFDSIFKYLPTTWIFTFPSPAYTYSNADAVKTGGILFVSVLFSLVAFIVFCQKDLFEQA